MKERILASGIAKKEYHQPTRTIAEQDIDFVLSARKIVFKKLTGCRTDYIDNVGYLIDLNGNITRDLTKALVVKLSCVVVKDDYGDKVNEWDLVDKRDSCISFYKNGLFIHTMMLKDAQQWLNDNPLPRKSIGKLTRGNVYAKYNGHCAYCGCELSIDEMRVDHHIAYMGEGGEDNLENYYPACEVCNRVKSNYSIEQFKQKIRRCGEIHRNRKKPVMADSDKIAIKYDLVKEDKTIEFFYETYNPNVNIDKIKKVLL